MSYIVGLDEVGRGCLFGPVVAAAVAFKEGLLVPEGIRDSKKISEKKRKEIKEELFNQGHFISVGICSPQEIDELNILQASLLAMKKALLGLDLSLSEVEEVRIDGNQKIPNLDPKIKQKTIIKGDSKDKAIAAASIVAKVYRDELVTAMEGDYPGYGLSKHKGYPTRAHKEALQKLGVSNQHRKSFKGVSELI